MAGLLDPSLYIYTVCSAAFMFKVHSPFSPEMKRDHFRTLPSSSHPAKINPIGENAFCTPKQVFINNESYLPALMPALVTMYNPGNSADVISKIVYCLYLS